VPNWILWYLDGRKSPAHSKLNIIPNPLADLFYTSKGFFSFKHIFFKRPQSFNLAMLTSKLIDLSSSALKQKSSSNNTHIIYGPYGDTP